jgi:hypothetical protein
VGLAARNTLSHMAAAPVVKSATPHPAKVRLRGENGQIGAQLRGEIAIIVAPKVWKLTVFTLFRKKTLLAG